MNGIRSIGIAALGLLLLVSLPVGAKVYKSVLPDGTVVYSDSPSDSGAKEVELPGIQIYQSPPLPASPAPEQPAAPAFEGYTTFEVASPEDAATVRDNGGTVGISLTIEPPLRRGHEVEIFVNGTSVGRGKATTVTLTNVDRGSHSVYAAITDGDGNELARTPAITFHLKRASRLNPPRGGG